MLKSRLNLFRRLTPGWSQAFFLVAALAAFSAEPGRKVLSGHVPQNAGRLSGTGRLASSRPLALALGLPLRNQDQLAELLRQLYDPASTNFHQFLTPPEFTARFGPTEADYATVKNFALTNGFTITGTHPNRVVLDVRADAAQVERAFHVGLRTFRHPMEARDFFAPDIEPTVDAAVPLLHIAGLDNYALPRPMSVVTPLRAATVKTAPQAGSGGGGTYLGNDFRASYVPGTTLTGSGQSVALLQFDGYYASDISAYISLAGLTNYPVVLTNIAVNGGVATPGGGNVEVCLDIEMVLSMAPGVSKIIVYEAPNGSTAWSTILSRIANDNLARQIGCSWGNTTPGAKDPTSETIFKQMAAQGQSFFNASGDSDAFTNGIPFPSESTNITQVGGTILSTTGPGGDWMGEVSWNRNNGVGTGGGVSANYSIPVWQQGLSMTSNHGSTTLRNVPDVAMTSESVLVIFNNGTTGSAGGTSCAAPLWAGFMALVNQQAAAVGQAPVGFINPAVYAIGKSSLYNSCFHDTVAGDNYNASSPTNFPAVAGYDLCTGWGTPNGTNLINALVWPPPIFLTTPASRNVTNGANVSFSATVGGAAPFTCQWLFNGATLSDGGNISGASSNILSITPATTNDLGSYQLVVSNLTGVSTSTVALLNVGFAPVVATPPTSQLVVSGSNAVFAAPADGSSPLAYQWRNNGTNLANGAGISGATSDVLALTAVTTNRSGNYSLYVTNLFGVVTSSVAVLTVVMPASIASSSLTNRTVECGRHTNTFAITAAGTAPRAIQWSLDGVPVTGATNSSLALTNLHLPNHTLSVVVTNLYGSVTSNTLVTVRDTLAPVIALIGSNPIYIELGSAFTDPGATASDLCAGSLAVATTGIVNASAVGTNVLTYKAEDGNGNTNTATRSVIVRDTTPPVIAWSITNLFLVADANCSALMPDVTGTNFVLASDLSGALTLSQKPTNNTVLFLGTNLVVITAKDASGNTATSTNNIIVSEQTPPVILTAPQSQTNTVGGPANFSVAATACTPLAYQWFYNDTALPAKTNRTLTLSSLNSTAAGSYFVVVSAAGGASTSAVATLTVNLIAANLTLISSANAAGFNESVNFTAAVSPASASGFVQFFTNAAVFGFVTVVAGQAVSAPLTSLPRGTNFITAIYSGDATHVRATNTFAQIVTNHPPTATAAFYTRYAGFPLSLAVAELATHWADVDGDALALAGASVSTNGVALTNSAGTLVYFNSNSVPDQFVCTISDDWGGTNVQLVNIDVVLPAISGVTVTPAGAVLLNATGAPGGTYILEQTLDLLSAANWQPVATNTLGPEGVWLFNDAQATNSPQQFYRLKLAP